MVDTALILLLYIACCYRAYRCIKPLLMFNNRWTVGDRTLAILLSIGGPISLVMSGSIYILTTLSDCQIWNKEARW